MTTTTQPLPCAPECTHQPCALVRVAIRRAMRRHPNDPAAWLRSAESFIADADRYASGPEQKYETLRAIYRAIAEGLARAVIDHEAAS